MKEPRIKMTNDEKLAVEALGTEGKSFNMKENSIESLIQREKTEKFNSELDSYLEQMENNKKTLDEAQSQVSYDISKAEIKPMLSRLLIKPFKTNPFQKFETKGGIIVNAGGYTPHIEKNPMTGRYEEQKEFIVTGCVVEVGPETKYLKEGDVVYYRVDTAVPVPFLNEGLVSLAESQIIAVVAEDLTNRFNTVKHDDSI